MGNAVTIEPRFEWRQDPDAYVLNVFLPGFAEDQVKVTVTSDSRSIHIGGSGHVNARKARYDVVKKDFDVPQNCKPNELRRRFANGVLTLILPKKIISQSAARPEKIPQALSSPPAAQELPPPALGGDDAPQKIIPGEEDKEKKQSEETRAPPEVPREKEADQPTPEKGQEDANSKPTSGDGPSNKTEEHASKVRSPEARDGTPVKIVQPDSAMDHVPRVDEETTPKAPLDDRPGNQTEQDASKVKSPKTRDGTPAKIIRPVLAMYHIPRVDEETTSKAPSGDGPSNQTEEDASKAKSPEAGDENPVKILQPDSATYHVPRVDGETTSKAPSGDGPSNQTKEDKSRAESPEARDGTPVKLVQPDLAMYHVLRIDEETTSNPPPGNASSDQTLDAASKVKFQEVRNETPAKTVQPNSVSNHVARDDEGTVDEDNAADDLKITEEPGERASVRKELDPISRARNVTPRMPANETPRKNDSLTSLDEGKTIPMASPGKKTNGTKAPTSMDTEKKATNECTSGTGLSEDRQSMVIVGAAFAVVMALGAYLSYKFICCKRK